MKDSIYNIPTYDNGVWTSTVFNSREEYKDFVISVFKEAGPDEGYSFDETSLLFNGEGRNFQKNGYYCNAPFRSKDFIAYWDDQKAKSVYGVIFKSNGNR